jgi:hypothetical protein
MNKDQLQEKLQNFKEDSEPLGVELYLQYEDNSGNIKTYLPAAEENKLGPALSKIVSSTIKSKFFVENEDYQYEVVNVNTAEANNIRQVYHISKNEIPRASKVFDDVINDTTEEYPANLELENVWSYVFKVQSISNGTIIFFKKNYPINVLKKDVTYGLIFSNNMLKLFDKDLLRLSKNFDVMLVDNELIILNRNEFEKAFDYVGAMQAFAANNVLAIQQTNLILDIEKIKALALNKTTLRKLLNINPNSKILTKRPTQIIKLAKKYKIEFSATEDGSQLDIKSKRAAINFVELLNDNFLKSEFSNDLYKIRGKSQIK